MITFPIPRDLIACQVTVPVSGSAASLRSILTAAALAAVDGREIVGAVIKPAGTAIQFRTSVGEAGYVIAADAEFPVTERDLLSNSFLVSTTGSTVTTSVLLQVATSA